MKDKVCSRVRAAMLMLSVDDFQDAHDEYAQYNSDDQLDRLQLTAEDSEYFRWILRSKSDRTIDPYHFPTHHPEEFAGAVMECIHGGFGGWSLEDQFVIRAFLSDIIEYCQASEELRNDK